MKTSAFMSKNNRLKNERRLGGKGLSLESFSNAKSGPSGYNPAIVKKQREFYKNAKYIKKYKKTLKQLGISHDRPWILSNFEDWKNEGGDDEQYHGDGRNPEEPGTDGMTRSKKKKTKKNNNKSLLRAREEYEKRREEEEKVRKEREEAIEAKREEIAMCEAKRKKLRVKMFKKTKSRQPVMKYRVEQLLEKLENSSR